MISEKACKAELKAKQKLMQQKNALAKRTKDKVTRDIFKAQATCLQIEVILLLWVLKGDA